MAFHKLVSSVYEFRINVDTCEIFHVVIVKIIFKFTVVKMTVFVSVKAGKGWVMK